MPDSCSFRSFPEPPGTGGSYWYCPAGTPMRLLSGLRQCQQTFRLIAAIHEQRSVYRQYVELVPPIANDGMIRLMHHFARLKFLKRSRNASTESYCAPNSHAASYKACQAASHCSSVRMSISVPYKSKNTTSYLGVCVTFSITGPLVGIVAALPAAAIATLQPPPLQTNELHALYMRLPQPPDCKR